MRYDLHVHSSYSDGRDGVEAILKTARWLRLDGLAITDHDTMKGSEAARRIARSLELDLVIVKGVEISTCEGHLIALGLDEMPPPGRSPEETIEDIHDLGGLSILPHPFHRFRHAIGRIPPVDAVEVYNSKYILGLSNARARREAIRMCLPMVAGSDSHSVDTLGLGVTILDAHSPEEVLQRISQGRTSIEGSRTPTRVFAKNFIRKMYRGIRRRFSATER